MSRFFHLAIVVALLGAAVAFPAVLWQRWQAVATPVGTTSDAAAAREQPARRTTAAQAARPRAVSGIVPYLDQRRRPIANLNVLSITDPADASLIPAPGLRLVEAEVRIENAGTGTIDPRSDWFVLRDGNGFLYAAGEGTDGQPSRSAADRSPFGPPIDPGQLRTGRLVFAVPESARLSALMFVPAADRLIALADLRKPGANSAERISEVGLKGDGDTGDRMATEATPGSSP